MAEPLTSQAWVAAWLQKADHDLETAEAIRHHLMQRTQEHIS